MKCLFDRNGIIDQVEDTPEVRQIGEQINTIRAALVATLTPEQRELFSQYDDATVTEGTVRVNAAIRAACGCSECSNVAE